MRLKIFLGFFLFFVLAFNRSNAFDNPCNTTCNENEYYSESYSGTNVVSSSINEFPNNNYCNGGNTPVIYEPNGNSYYSGGKWRFPAKYTGYSCISLPTCEAPKVLNKDDPLNPFCENPPIPNCDVEGQSWDTVKEKCICDNGYPSIYENGIERCQVPECAPYDGTKPLYATNVTKSYCDSLTNSTLGFTSSYYSNDSISCCYADSYKEKDDNCPPNYIRDNFGICQPIREGSSTPNITSNPDGSVTDNNTGIKSNPDGTVEAPSGTTVNADGTINNTNLGGSSSESPDTTGNCQDGYAYNYLTGGCSKLIPSGSNSEFNGSLPSDQFNDNSYSDGNLSNGEGFELKFDNDFNPDEKFYDNLFSKDSTNFSSKALQDLKRVENTFLSIHTVTVPMPSSGSCGCTDMQYGGTIKGKSFSQTITLCEYIEIVLHAVKAVLWLMVVWILLARIKEIV